MPECLQRTWSGIVHPFIHFQGDGAVGKTSMIITHSTNQFPDEYCPVFIENSTVLMTAAPYSANCTFWDTPGQEDYDRLRPLSYPQTNVFILAFSVTHPASFANIQARVRQSILG